jgi:hypothetical protein
MLAGFPVGSVPLDCLRVAPAILVLALQNSARGFLNIISKFSIIILTHPISPKKIATRRPSTMPYMNAHSIRLRRLPTASGGALCLLR